LLQYAWEAACAASSLDEVLVAADCEEIAACVRGFGGRAELTGEHPSGTDRVAEVVRRCCVDAEIIVNLQGDEPELKPESIDQLVTMLANHPQSEMATLAAPLKRAEDVRDPSCVKVVTAADGRALYFSRSVIPFVRAREIEEFFESAAKPQSGGDDDSPSSPLSATAGFNPPWLLHVGIYAYRRLFLLRLTERPPSPLERLEKLEQLRALEAGATIRVAIINEASVGIDTPEDYARFLQRQTSAVADNLL